MVSQFLLAMRKPRSCEECGEKFLPYKSKAGMWYKKKCLPCKQRLAREKIRERLENEQ